MTLAEARTQDDTVAVDVETLYRDGIVGRKGAFSRQWAEDMREDVTTAFWEAIQRPGGAVGRGPRRWYVEIHPQNLRGFVELVTHPWVTAMAAAVLGPKYEMVEVGFDTPFQGAKKSTLAPGLPLAAGLLARQADHLAGLQPDGRRRHARHGTVRDRARHAMGRWSVLEPRDVPAPGGLAPLHGTGYPQISADGRHLLPLGLTMHRGTAHASPIARPVLVLGVDAPGAGHAALHDMMVTQDFHDALPQSVREHLVCRVAPELIPVTQKHDIEGLVMGAD